MPTAYQPESGVAPSWPLKGASQSVALWARMLYLRPRHSGESLVSSVEFQADRRNLSAIQIVDREITLGAVGDSCLTFRSI
jgi:hypothetical protein